MPYANNKGADQPAHPCSLICAFVVRCLDSIIHVSLVLYLKFQPSASFCGCAGWFVSYLFANPEDRFSHDLAQMLSMIVFSCSDSVKQGYALPPGHRILCSRISSQLNEIVVYQL